ncbi:hypothetical protein FQN57_003462 [Myotisia sp. PD_48]|nr:hypothetical protein FQN57_003462 [Myotisia sp. PD_48]
MADAPRTSGRARKPTLRALESDLNILRKGSGGVKKVRKTAPKKGKAAAKPAADYQAGDGSIAAPTLPTIPEDVKCDKPDSKSCSAEPIPKPAAGDETGAGATIGPSLATILEHVKYDQISSKTCSAASNVKPTSGGEANVDTIAKPALPTIQDIIVSDLEGSKVEHTVPCLSEEDEWAVNQLLSLARAVFVPEFKLEVEVDLEELRRQYYEEVSPTDVKGQESRLANSTTLYCLATPGPGAAKAKVVQAALAN